MITTNASTRDYEYITPPAFTYTKLTNSDTHHILYRSFVICIQIDGTTLLHSKYRWTTQ